MLAIAWSITASSSETDGEVRSMVFLVHRGQLVASQCDGSPTFLIGINAAYSALYVVANPIRADLRNGIPATVRWKKPADAPPSQPNLRRIAQLVRIAAAVPCDPT